MGRRPFQFGFLPGRNNRGAGSRRRRAAAASHRRLRIEPLESRHLLATLTVNSLADNTTAGNDLVTLREAIFAANNNTLTDLGQTGSGADTIEFAPNLSGTILLNFGEYVISEALTINGPGRDLLTIDAQHSSRIFSITTTGDISLTGLTLANGSVLDNGGAIKSNSHNLSLTAMSVSGNHAANGGGIFSQYGLTLTDTIVNLNVAETGNGGGFSASQAIASPYEVTLTNCTISNNTAATNGGGFKAGFYDRNFATGHVTIKNSLISGNTAADKGGGFFAHTGLTVYDSQITSNSGGRGGGVYSYQRISDIRTSTISGNQATFGGGGIYVSPYGNAKISSSTIEGNIAGGADGSFMGFYSGGGGGILCPDATITGSTIQNNQASAGSGGGIRGNRSQTIISITDSQILKNTAAQSGGGIRGLVISLTRSTVSGNSALLHGGGAYAQITTATNSSVSNNSSSGKGGGINTSALTLTQSTVGSNNAAGDGGGAYLRGSSASSFTESTISGNISAGDGGGLYVKNATTLTSSTVSGNQATGNGGGLYAKGAVTVKHSTIAFNRTTTGSGGGVWNDNDTKLFRASIIAGNTAGGGGPDLRPGTGTLDFRFNLLSDNAGTVLVESHVTDVNGNLIGSSAGGGIIDPKLSTLFNFGGPTPTHALLPGSPAIDAIALPVTPATPIHQYELNGTFADSKGGPNLISQGGTLSATGYQFGPNQGPNLSASSINPATYSIEIVFSLAALPPSRQKILDFHNLTQDAGLYANGDGLQFVNGANTSGVFTAGTTHSLLLTRDDATDIVRAYVDGVEKWNFVDAAGTAVFDGPDKIIRFFRDDNTTGGTEAGSGFLDRVRIYNAALTPAQINGNEPAFEGTPPAFDERGTPFARVAEGDGLPGVRIDFGAYESQGVPTLSVYDYNDDGVVNAADYTVWRSTRGLSGLPQFTGADGDGDGAITLTDYNLWKAHYGEKLTTTTVIPASGLAIGSLRSTSSHQADDGDALNAVRMPVSMQLSDVFVFTVALPAHAPAIHGGDSTSARPDAALVDLLLGNLQPVATRGAASADEANSRSERRSEIEHAAETKQAAFALLGNHLNVDSLAFPVSL